VKSTWCPPRRGDLEGALGDGLVLDVRQIHLRRWRPTVFGQGRLDRDRDLTPQVRHQVDKGADRMHLEARPGGLGGVGDGGEHAPDATRGQVTAEGERPTDRPDGAVEPKLPDEGAVTQLGIAALEAGLIGRAKDGHRDREVKGAALLPKLGGGEVHGQPVRGKAEAAVAHRRAHPLPRLLHGLVGQADDAERRQAGGDIGLDFDAARLDAVKASGQG
jgi:hypothetical protein